MTTAQEYVENAKQGWWKAFMYKGYAVIQQTERKSERRYSVHDKDGECVANARTQYTAKLYIDDDIYEKQQNSL